MVTPPPVSQIADLYILTIPDQTYAEFCVLRRHLNTTAPKSFYRMDYEKDLGEITIGFWHMNCIPEDFWEYCPENTTK